MESAPTADFETLFHTHYEQVARVIARVIKDTARSEEIAVEVFLKLWHTPQAQGEKAGGWLYRTAVRMALNELRRHTRSSHYENLSSGGNATPTPEDIHAAAEEQEHVRQVLARRNSRQAELLLLRSHGLSYEELAAAVEVSPASIGTLLSRAQQAFRKEYTEQFGGQNNEE